MKAEAKSLRFLGEGKKLSVPFFQRNYVWNQDNWHELIETFENAEIMPFLGSIILKEDSSQESTIIDGQQRLTTITILAKAIYDSLSDESKQPGSGIRHAIESFLFYRKNAADDFKDSLVRIEHSQLDRKDYSRVISAGVLKEDDIVDLDTIDSNSGNILRCYKYYREVLEPLDDKSLKDLFNSMFNESRKVFVLIELQHGDINEQTIFDTINRAGMRLSTADIIKNNLFKHLLEACGEDEARKQTVIDEYKNCWESVFYPTMAVSDMWDEERVFGNVKHSNLEFLLYCVACIKWGEDGDMFSRLENVFEKSTEKMGYFELLTLIAEIKEYALIFKKYVLEFSISLNDESANEYFKYEEGVRRLMLILQKFGVQMFYPYVLKRLKEVNQNENDTQLLFDFSVLESFVMRRKVANKGTHDYTSKCYQITQNGITYLIGSDLAKSEAGISDAEIKLFLANTKDETAKMILFWIELYRRKGNAFDERALEYRYTLEHIMPKKWKTYWSDVPVKTTTGEEVSATTEAGITEREGHIQSLGNKTLLTCNLNSAVKNAAFMDKIDGQGENKPGYKRHTSLLLTKELVEQSAKDPVWDESHIREREQNLAAEFITLWPTFSEYAPKASCDELDGSILDGITAEELADPVKLVNAII
ncbi:MAG: DUF262 domain-containing HNH endonuclease family protein [Candidatus Fimisoma sp.]|nr:DUF262 domain-containing HNH endonuclease family protein [Candidatus Fimisoma sp.]